MLRHGQFANVVQERGSVQGFHFSGSHIQLFSYFNGVHPHPLQVVVSSVILGFDGQSQRLNSSQVEVCHLLDVALLVFQFAEVETVRTVDQVNDRHYQQRRLPAKFSIQPAHHAREPGADQVIRERPEITLHPDSP